MSIEALVLGKLHEPAKALTGNNSGRQFVTAKVRAAVADDAAVFVNVVAFAETAGAALLALDAGDSLALAGTLKPGAWIDREGNARPSLDMVAAQVLTVYGLTKKRKASAEASSRADTPSAASALDEGCASDPQSFGSQHGERPW